MTYKNGKREVLKTLLLAFLFTGLLFVLITTPAFARTRVQSGETGESSSDSHNINIDPVDLDKSIIIFQFRSLHADLNQGQVQDPRDHAWAAKFNSNSQIQIHRDTSGSGTLDHVWYVIESDAFQVEYVEVHFNSSELGPKTVNLTNLTPNGNPVNFIPDKSFVVGRVTNFASTNDNSMNATYFDYELKFDENGETQDHLIIQRDTANTGGDTVACDVWLFVVRLHDDSTVYAGDISNWTYQEVLAVDELHDNAGSPASVDRTKAWMTFTKRNTYSALRAENSGNINSDTTTGFKRLEIDSRAGTTNLHYWVHELGTLGRVESGQVLILMNTEWYKEVPLNKQFDVTRSFALSTQNSTGPGVMYHRVRHVASFVDNGTKLHLERGEPGQNAICEAFEVELEPMRLFTPNGGGEPLVAGQTYNITWYAPDQIENVEIVLSNDGGATYPIQVAASTLNDDLFEWTVGNDAGIIGDQMRIKVRDVNWNEMGRTDDKWSCDYSDTDFEIIADIHVTYPNGTEEIVHGTPTDIIWDFYGDPAGRTVAIKYSDNGGSSYNHTLATGIAPDAGSYSINWGTNPLPLSSVLKVKVEQEGEESRVFDTSDDIFTVKGEITVTIPNGDEVWEIGETKDITWDVSGASDMPSGVNISVSRNLGGSWDGIASSVNASSPSYPWTVEAPGSTDCLVKVQSVDFPLVLDQSDTTFEIRQVITVTEPSTPGEVWKVGEYKDIVWELKGTIDKVEIHYKKGTGGSWIPITESEYPTGYPAGSPYKYTWQVPNDIHDEVYIRVRDFDNHVIEYITPYICIKGKITVGAPNGGEVYTVGQADVVVTWSTTGTMAGEKVRVWFAKDGVDYAYMDVTAAMGYPSGKDVEDGNLAWNPVPDEITETGKIKVELIGDESSVYDVSDATFSIQGGLALTYPNGGVTLYVGATDATRTITWDVDGDLTGQQVTLTYTVGGSGDKSIGSTAAMDGSFDWGASAGIPDDIGDNVIVKVALSSKPDIVFDVSDSANKIRGKIASIDSPTSVDEWYVDSDMYNIAWTMENDAVSMGNLEIRYSTGGASFPATQVVETNVAPLASPVSWQVPDEEGIITNAAQIKIFAINYASDILKISDEFKIKGKINLTRPDHGTDYIWYVGTDENIEWATKGITDIDKVNVYWDEGSGTYANQIADGISNAEGFLWENIPAAAMGDTLRVKVAGYGDYSDVSDTSPQVDRYITVKGRVVIESPNGGQEWIAGTEYPIQWAPHGDIGNVHIEYHDGVSWHDITDPETGVPATKLSEPWTIPTDALPGSAYKIRITALAPYSDVTDESDDLFTVRGSLDLTYPDGGAAQEFNVNDTEDIQWTKTGTIGNIELRYSITGGEPYLEANQIATNVSPTNQPEGEKYGAGVYYYPWSIPAPALSDTVKVKIFLISDEENVYDESISTFKIKGSLQLTGESNGEGTPLWKVGENKTITWDVVGALGNIDIYYAKDGVQFLNSVALGVPCGTGGNGSYLWEPIPNDVIDGARNENIKLKITTPAGDVESISENPIIIQGQIIVAQPDPILYVDDPDNPNDYYTITWTTKGVVGQVKLSYDTDGNGTYDNFIEQIDNDDDYDWNIPNAIGDQVKFKVEDSVYSEVFGTTTDFEIKGQIKVTSPDSTVKDADAWIVDNTAGGLPSQQLIEWTNYGDLGFDGGSNYYAIIKHAPNGVTFSETITEFANGNNGPQNYNWTIPDSIAKINRIKVIDKNDEDVYDISDEFEIKGKLVVTEPGPEVGNDYFIGSTPIDITWNYAGTLGNIDMFISYDDGANWEAEPFVTVDVGYTQPYQLSVPDNPTTQGKIKLEQTTDRTYVRSESKRFDIKGAVFIDSPTSLTEWAVDAADNKTEWHTTGSISSVTLDLDTTGGSGGYSIPIVSSTDNDGEYIWNIPTEQYVAVTSGNITSDQCKVRIRDAGDATVEDFSDEFKIKPVLEVTTPVGGEKWYRGTSEYITWAAPKGKADNLKIEYSLDGGSTWETPAVTDSVPSSAGQFLWQIPNTPNDDTVVKISKVGDPDIFDISPVWFSLFADIELLQPDGSVDLSIGSDYLITWNPIGSLTECRIMYATVENPTPGDWKVCKDASEQLADIPDPVNTTQFSWRIPDEPSTHVLVKIYEKSHADDVLDISVDDNAIIGSITVDHPTNGNVMIAEKPYAIQYTKVGSLTNFKIDYHDGSQWYPIVANTTDYPSYTWASVDDNISSTVKVRVTDVNNTTVYGESSADNIIKGEIDLTDPDGYETLVVGVPFDITWNKWGDIGNVKIEYSTDDFGDDIRTVVESYDANSSPYPWTPGIDDITNADNVKVRVTSIGGIPVTDKSQNPFKIQGKISNIQPSGSAVIWKKDETKNVTWDQDGNIDSVDIKYKTISTDTFNKTLVTDHTGHTDGSNSAQITVPDENSEDCWVQVLDHGNSDVKDSSAQAFSIRPVITVSKPVLDSNIVVDSSNIDAIEWSLNGSTKVTLVDILYSTDGIGGPFDKTIDTGVDATLGEYNWDNVADNISSTVVVMVIDKTGGTGNPNVFGKSPSFDIVGGISVIEPHQDEDLSAGNAKTIEWLTHGTLGDIKIYYYHDGDYEHIHTIDSNNNSSWPWTVPPQIENQSTIKITDANTESEPEPEDVISGISGEFDIIGNFKLYDAGLGQTPPTVLLSGSSHTIEWNNYDLEGEIPNAKLEFFDGTTLHDIDYKSDPETHDGLVGNTGSYLWTVPTDVRATNCYFKISDPNNSAAYNTSSTFEVRPVINVSAPLSSAKWTIGTKTGNFIEWNITGPVSTVAIEYSKDNGLTYSYTIVSSLDAGSSSYEWDIPTNEDIITTHEAGNENRAMVRVYDTSKPVIFDTSASFMVKGTITVDRPNTDDSLPVLDLFNIEWHTPCTDEANMGDVKIEFRPKDTESYTTIDTVAFDASPYTLWAPPVDSIRGGTKEAQIKITDADNTEVYDESDKFNIKGKIQINEPNIGAQTWFVGDTNRQISWTPTGVFSNTEIHYAKDTPDNDPANFLNPVLIATPANLGSGVPVTYDWLPEIPTSAMGNNIRIRVRDAADYSVQSISQDPIIIGGSITVNEPQAGRVWKKDEAKDITWTSAGNITNVDIQYKTSIISWTDIATNVGSDPDGDPATPYGEGSGNTYTWTVADLNDEECYIRVMDHLNPAIVLDESGQFSIRPVITVSEPALNSNIEVGSNGNTISWDLNGSTEVANVKIYYSVDGDPFDNHPIDITGTVDATTGTYTWNSVSDTITDNAVVRIVDADNSNVYGDSPSFDIIGRIEILSPSADEDWGVGTNQTISWIRHGSLGAVKLYYWHDGDYGYIATVDGESYPWNNIPAQVENNTTIKIVDLDTEGETDEVSAISAQFDIIGGFIMYDPNYEPPQMLPAVLSAGSSHTVRWNNLGLQSEIPNAKLEFFDGENWHDIDYKSDPETHTGIVTNSGSYSWTVPTDVKSIACQFRISDPNNSDVKDTSNTFEIRAVITVTSPQAGDEWNINDTRDILWTIEGVVENVKIEYSKDGGANYTETLVASRPAGQSPYQWTILPTQDVISDQGMIMVSDAEYPDAKGTSSEEFFSILGDVTITAPIEDDVLTVGEPFDIKWDAIGTGDVIIEYSETGTAPFTQIAVVAHDYNDGVYPWAPGPDDITGGESIAKIVIKYEFNPTKVRDESGSFEVEGKLTWDEPLESGLMWTVNTNHDIKWTPTGNFSPVKVEYSTNAFLNEDETGLLAAGITNSGHGVQKVWSFSVPDDISDDVKIRVSDEADTDVYAISPNKIKFVGALEVTAPETTGMAWNVGDTDRVISWYSTGTITNVRVEYKTSLASETYHLITADDGEHTSGSNSYIWTAGVADENSEDCYIRVSDVDHYNDVYNVSTVPFSIRPVITVTAPVEDQNLKVGSTNNTISWNVNSSNVNRVDIYYATDGVDGTFDELITSGTPCSMGGNSYNAWTVDNTISGNVVVRVRDKSNDIVNPNVFGKSTPFDIIGNIIIGPPNSGEKWRAGTVKNIYWGGSQGSMGLIRLYYYYNGQYNLIDTGGDINSDTVDEFPWTVPADLIDNTTIKILDVDTEGQGEDEVVGISAPFNIIGSIDVTNPDTADPKPVWKKDETNKLIEWNSTGIIPNVKIEYKTSATGSYVGNTIVANDGGHTTAGANSYIWAGPVPDVNSEDCYIRVSDVNYYDDVYGESQNPFAIRPVITVSTPAEDDNLVVFSDDNPIEWSLNGSTKVTTVDIHYSIDGEGYTGNVIKTGVSAAAGSSDWDDVPDEISDNVKIRVMDSGNNNVYGESESFDIIGSVIMTDGVHTPDSNSNWTVGATDKFITWVHTGSNMGNVNIRYRHDGGAYSAPINPAPIPIGEHKFNWPAIPSVISEHVQIKVETENNPTEEYAESPEFKIKGGFIIDTPSAPLKSGTSYEILWDNLGLHLQIPQARLEFYDGATWHNIDYKSTNTGIVDNSAGTYNWTVPDDVRNLGCMFRISDPDNPEAVDTSGTFAILPYLEVTAPLSSAKWTIGTQTGNWITWDHTGVDYTVKIEYSKDNGSTYTYTLLTGGTLASAGAFEWDIPTGEDILSASEAKIKVSDASFPTLSDTSASFMVKGTITVDRPNTDDSLPVLDIFNIEWSTNCTGEANMGDVKLEFRAKDTESYTIIDTVAFNSSPYTLWAPTIDSIRGSTKEAQIKITDVDNSEVYDESDKFNIKGKIALNSPDLDAPTWFVESIEQIKWTPTGTFSYVKIEYSTDGGTTWEVPPIAATYANSASGVQGTYDWTIPDKIGSNLKVRVSDANNSNVAAVSQVPFTIKANLTVTEPNGGETWYVGDTDRKIKWNSTGSIETVRIEYSKNNGGQWTEIVPDAPAGLGAGEYQWPSVADAISDLCLIRVSSTDDSTVQDVSDGVFSIKGKIDVLTPDGNERWVALSSGHDITWDITGSIANVKITYSVDGGDYTNVITSSTNAANRLYTWNGLPEHVSDDYRIKIADVDDEDNVYDISPEFNIIGEITVTEPSGGEQLKVGNDFKVEWTKTGDFENVRLEYSTDGGANYNYQIVAETSAANEFYWWNDISEDTVSPNVMLKITDADDIDVYDESELFRIQGIFDITAPDGGEVWAVGSSYDIEWDTTGNVTHVNLEYSIDGGNSWIDPPIAAGIGDAGIKSWTIPDTISDLVRVRVSDANDTAASNISASNFKIRGDLEITSPNGTESWLVGTSEPITWSVTGSIDTVKLEFSVDGQDYEQIPGAFNLTADSGDGTGSFLWTIPDEISSNVLVKITNEDDPTVFDETDDSFTITGKLDLNSPVGGEVWYVQEQEEISWAKTGTIPTVKLEYSVGGGAYTQITDAESLSDTSFNWIIPDDISEQVKVRVSNTNATKPTIPGISGLFAIKGKLELNKPDSSSIWEVGQPRDITWDRTGSIDTVKLEFSLDGGNNYIIPPIISSLDATGDPADSYKYTWTIPPNISNNVVVKITNNDDSSVADTSPIFKIAGYLDLTEPDGGEIWVVGDEVPDSGDEQAIKWMRYGNISTVDLAYSKDGGIDGYPYSIVEDIPASNQNYNWEVPDEIGTQLKVKISDHDGTSYTVGDTSEGVFEIRGSLTLTSPVGGDVWICSTEHDIAWTKTGSISNVKLEYSTDGGLSYPYTIASSISASSGPYEWTAPNTVSKHAVVKITNLGDEDVDDESEEFTIRGGFTITHPISTDRWAVSSTKLITWDTLGIIPNVVLYYSTQDGADGTWKTLTSLGNTNSCQWTIPWEDGIITDIARIKIEDVLDSDASDTSEQFTIHGTLNLTRPNDGSEDFEVDSTEPINWEVVGPIIDVKLEYSYDNGENWTTIVEETDAQLETFPWSPVPDTISSHCLVRISDADDSLVVDTSDHEFTIKGSLEVIVPNNNEDYVVYHATENPVTEEIKWRTHGDIGYVNLEYSTNGGDSWNSIESEFENIPDAGGETTYNWEVPNAISNTVRVRVTDFTNSTVKDISDENFKIVGKLIVKEPNGEETWYVGTTETIKWYAVGNIIGINLYYKDNLGSYIPINTEPIGSGAGLRSKVWTIPDDTPNITTPNARIKVEDANNPVVEDISDEDFRIAARFEVLEPHSGEVLQAGATTKRIEWHTYGTVAYVKLECIVDGDTEVILGAESLENEDYFDGWVVPQEVSPHVFVRVSDVTDAGAYDDSGEFTVQASFNLFSPTPGDLKINEQYAVKWDQVGITKDGEGNSPRVKLEYAFNQDFTPAVPFVGDGVVAPSPAGGGRFEYDWTIPDEAADGIRPQMWIKVSDPNNPNAFDTIGPFRIVPEVTVDEPNDSSKWYVYDTQYNPTRHTISGAVTGSVPGLYLQYSVEGGAPDTWEPITYLNINTSGPGPHNWSYDWDVDAPISGQVKVKAYDERAADAAYGVSDGEATIRAKFNLSPIAGPLTVGETAPITWTNSGTVENVKIEYSIDSGNDWNPIVDDEVPFNDGIVSNGSGDGRTFDWTVPDDIGHNTRIRVSHAEDPAPNDSEAYASSDSDFRIKGALEVISPNGDEFWEITKEYLIAWNTTGTIPEVDILYSTDGGSSYNPITTTDNDDSELWTIPDAATPNARVMVRDARTAENDVSDTSNADFHICGYFEVLSPNTGDESWIVNSNYPIQWQWGGTIERVKLYYSTDSGNTFPEINYIGEFDNGVGDGGTHSQPWTIPDDISDQVRVKIQDAEDADIFDTSDNDFKIIGSFDLISPNGEERWVTNETHQIRWLANGDIPNVKLQYSKDGFGSDVNDIVSSYLNAQSGEEQSYDWTIPDDRSNTIKVRVVDVNDDEVYDESENDFAIDYYNITWTVRDLMTNKHLGELSVHDEPNDSVMYQIIVNEEGIGSPITVQVPYGSRTATWTQTGYGEVKKAYSADADKEMETIFMETTAIHIWRAESAYAYDPKTKDLSVEAWLERDGKVMSGAVRCDIEIYDRNTLIKTLHEDAPPEEEVEIFHLSWTDAGADLEAGKVYTTVVEMEIGSGGVFRTPNSFTITAEETMQSLEDTIGEKLDIPLSMVKVQVKDILDDQTETIERKMNEQTGIIESKMNQQTMVITEALTSIEEPATLLQSTAAEIKAAGEEFTEAALRRTGTLILPDGVRIGEVLKVQYQIISNVTPLMDVYNAKKEQVVRGRPMTEAKDSPGFYSCELEIDEKYFSPGETITIMASESSTGNLEVGSVVVQMVTGQLILPNSVLVGETLHIRYRHITGLNPLLTVVNSEDKDVVMNKAMGESSETEGLYVYDLDISSDDFVGGAPMTVKVSESTTGSLDVGSIVVETTTLTQVQGLISGQTGEIRGLREDTLLAFEEVERAINSGLNVTEALENLKETVLTIPEETAKEISEQGPPEEVSNLLNDISDRLVTLAGEEGYDISTMVSEALSKSPTLKDIQGKAYNISDTTDLILSIVESRFGEGEVPFVVVMYER